MCLVVFWIAMSKVSFQRAGPRSPGQEWHTPMHTPSTHPLTGCELRALRAHQRESKASPFVFVSECSSPLTAFGFSRMVERAAANAKLDIKAHAHQSGARGRPPHHSTWRDQRITAAMS